MISARLRRIAQGAAGKNVPPPPLTSVEPFIKQGVQRILAALRKGTPVSPAGYPINPTRGDLRKGWYATIENDKPKVGQIRILIRNRDRRFAKLHKFLTEGTRPHVINPIRARMLRFFWLKQKQWAAANTVKHPGTKPATAYVAAVQEAQNEGKRLQKQVSAAVQRYYAVKRP